MFLAPGLLPDLKTKHNIESDTELAKLLGCDRSTMHRMESHKVPLSPAVASRIVARFHVPFAQLASERKEREKDDG